MGMDYLFPNYMPNILVVIFRSCQQRDMELMLVFFSRYVPTVIRALRHTSILPPSDKLRHLLRSIGNDAKYLFLNCALHTTFIL